MRLLDLTTQRYFNAIIEKMEEEDFKVIAEKGSFEFNWLEEKDNEVFKIRSRRGKKILGLISLIDIPVEYRLHIQLIECAKDHVGIDKKIDRIAGYLIAFACKLAFSKGYGGFVSLVPKTRLISHYKNRYSFQQFGRQLVVEWESSQHLIKKYIDDEKI